jgi:hypothetical protein
LDGLVLALIARIPLAGVEDFQAYEAHVLPLLAAYGGTLERRLRNADGRIELHVLRFASRDGLDRFRQDERRAAAAPLLQRSGATVELIELRDV